MAHSVRRRLKLYLIGAGIGFAIIGALAWLALPGIVERGLKDRMTSAGIPVSHLTVTAVSFHKAELADLRIGDHDELTAENIIARYTLGDLIAGQVDIVEIHKLRLSARLDANGLTVSGLERIAGARRQEGTGFRSAPRIAIQSGLIDLATPLGPVVLPFDATVTPLGDGNLRAAIETRVGTQMGRLAGKIDVLASPNEISADAQIDDGTITIGDTLRSAVAGRLTARLAAGGEPTLKGDLQLGATSIAGFPFASGSVSVDGSRRQWTSRLSLNEGEDKSDLQATLTVDNVGQSPHVAFQLRLAATAASELWKPAAAAGPSSGTAAVDLSLSGRPPSGPWTLETMAERTRILELLTSGDLDGSVKVEARHLNFPSFGDLQSATGDFRLQAADGALTLTPASKFQATVLPVRDLAERLRLPAETIRALDGPIKLETRLTAPLRLVVAEGGSTMSAGVSLAATSSAGDDLTISGSGSLQLGPRFQPTAFAIAPAAAHVRVKALPWADAADISCEGEIKGVPGRFDALIDARGTLSGARLGEVGANEVQIDLEAAVRANGDQVDLRVPTDGALILRRMSSSYLAAKVKELTLPIIGSDQPALTAQFGARGVTELEHSIKLGLVNAKIPLLIGGAKPTRTVLHSRDATLVGRWKNDIGYQLSVDFADSTIDLPDQQVVAQDLQAELRRLPGQAASSIEFRIAKIQSRQEPALFAPVGFSGTAEVGAERIVMKGILADPRKRFRISVDLTHSTPERKGQLKLTMRPVQFRPDGLQPRDLLPAIGGRIIVAEGATAIAGGLAWTKGKVRSDLKLLLEDLTLAFPEVDVVRLNSVIAIRSLVPFATERSQQLAIGLLDIGIPLSDALASFRIEPGPKLVVEDAKLSLAEGQVAVTPIDFDPSDPRIDATLHLTDVKLERLLELAEIDGLTATGRLSGRLPLSIRDGAVEIRDAVLDATEPGVLRYAPKETPSALQGAGDSMALALQALSNFQYSELRLTLNRAAGGDTVAIMHVKGRNPDFYGGYPVEFNLNVSGKLDQMLDRGLSSYRVPDTIRERLQQFSP